MPILRAVERIKAGVGFAAAIVAILLVTVVFRAIAVANATTVGFAYLVVILLIAAGWGLFESVVASIVATICFTYFFLPPFETFTITGQENWIALFAFLISALIASQLSDRARRRTAEARIKQLEMERL